MEKKSGAEYYGITVFLCLAYFPLLFAIRFLDDNTQTSWRWVFSDVNRAQIFLFLFGSVVLACLLSRLAIIRKVPIISFFALVCCAVLPGFEIPESVLDTSRYFIQAKYLELYGVGFFLKEWGNTIPVWTDLPLIPFVYGLIFRYLGEVRIYIQFWNIILFFLSVVFTYQLGKLLWNKDVGFLAGLLLLSIPYLSTQVPLMLVDVSTMFFVIFSLHSFVYTLQKGGINGIVVTSIALSLSLSVKFSVFLIFSLLPFIVLIYLFIYRKEHRARNLVLVRSAFIFIAVAMFVIVLFNIKPDVFKSQIRLMLGYQWSGLQRWQESYWSTFFFQSHPFMAFTAVFACYAAVKKKDITFLIPAIFVFLIFIIQLKRIRYSIPLFPFYSLMGGYGLNEIRKKEIRYLIAFFIVFSSMTILYTGFLPFLKKISLVNLQQAGKYLEQTNCDSGLVIIKPQHFSTANTAIVLPLIDLYTSKQLYFSRQPSPVSDNQVSALSSLRFTWEFNIPEFYLDYNSQDKALAIVISSDKFPPNTLEPAFLERQNLTVLKQFNTVSGVFRFRTLVTILANDCLPTPSN